MGTFVESLTKILEGQPQGKKELKELKELLKKVKKTSPEKLEPLGRKVMGKALAGIGLWSKFDKIYRILSKYMPVATSNEVDQAIRNQLENRHFWIARNIHYLSNNKKDAPKFCLPREELKRLCLKYIEKKNIQELHLMIEHHLPIVDNFLDTEIITACANMFREVIPDGNRDKRSGWCLNESIATRKLLKIMLQQQGVKENRELKKKFRITAEIVFHTQLSWIKHAPGSCGKNILDKWIEVLKLSGKKGRPFSTEGKFILNNLKCFYFSSRAAKELHALFPGSPEILTWFRDMVKDYMMYGSTNNIPAIIYHGPKELREKCTKIFLSERAKQIKQTKNKKWQKENNNYNYFFIDIKRLKMKISKRKLKEMIVFLANRQDRYPSCNSFRFGMAMKAISRFQVGDFNSKEAAAILEKIDAAGLNKEALKNKWTKPMNMLFQSLKPAKMSGYMNLFMV